MMLLLEEDSNLSLVEDAMSTLTFNFSNWLSAEQQASPGINPKCHITLLLLEDI